MNKRGFTLVELILVVFLTAIVALIIILPALARSSSGVRFFSCPNNLKQMGIIFRMYANESPGNLFPPMLLRENPGAGTVKGESRKWTMLPAPSWSAICPEYLGYTGVTYCPNDSRSPAAISLGHKVGKRITSEADIKAAQGPDADPAQMGVGSYHYTGWLVDDAEVLASSVLVAELLLGMDGNGSTISLQEAQAIVDGDLPLSGTDPARVRDWIEQRTGARSSGNKFPERAKIWEGFQLRGNTESHVIYRLCENIERKLLGEANPEDWATFSASIPVLWDLTYYQFENPNPEADVRTTHVPPGFNCLNMDGHVEFVRLTSRDHPLCSERLLALGAPDTREGYGPEDRSATEAR